VDLIDLAPNVDQWRALVNKFMKKNAVFWDVTPCGSYKNRRRSETSVVTIGTRRNIPEDDILQSHSRENLMKLLVP
jgi:hypothetical protein